MPDATGDLVWGRRLGMAQANERHRPSPQAPRSKLDAPIVTIEKNVPKTHYGSATRLVANDREDLTTQQSATTACSTSIKKCGRKAVVLGAGPIRSLRSCPARRRR